MYHDIHPDVLRQLAADRHEQLRQAAGNSRLRRAARVERSKLRRQHRAGPER